jgi:vitamin B12 transporter
LHRSTVYPDIDGYLNFSMSGSLSKGLGGGSEIGVRVNATYAKLDYDDYYSGNTTTDIHTQTSANYLTGLYLKNQINDRWVSRIDINASQVEIKAHKNGGLVTNNDTRQNQVRWFNTYQYSETQSFNFGAEDVRANSVTTYDGDASRNARAIFAGHQGKYDRLSSQLNVRYDNITSGQEVTTSLFGLGYQLTQGLKVVSSISSGFNSPTLYEQTDTPRLVGEKYKSREFGFVQANPRGLTRLVYFNTSTTNAISYTGVGFCSSGCYENIGKVENSGFELSSKLSLSGYLLKLSGITQDPWDVSNNRQLERRAKQYGSVDVSRAIGSYDLGVKLYGSAERKDRTGGNGTLAGYSTWSFYASKKIDKEWTARLKLDNAFDRDYQLAYGYNTPGRGIFATLQYQPK